MTSSSHHYMILLYHGCSLFLKNDFCSSPFFWTTLLYSMFPSFPAHRDCPWESERLPGKILLQVGETASYLQKYKIYGKGSPTFREQLCQGSPCAGFSLGFSPMARFCAAGAGAGVGCTTFCAGCAAGTGLLFNGCPT